MACLVTSSMYSVLPSMVRCGIVVYMHLKQAFCGQTGGPGTHCPITLGQLILGPRSVIITRLFCSGLVMVVTRHFYSLSSPRLLGDFCRPWFSKRCNILSRTRLIGSRALALSDRYCQSTCLRVILSFCPQLWS